MTADVGHRDHTDEVSLAVYDRCARDLAFVQKSHELLGGHVVGDGHDVWIHHVFHASHVFRCYRLSLDGFVDDGHLPPRFFRRSLRSLAA